MTKLTVDYVSGVDETDYQEYMSDAEVEAEQQRQWNEIYARVQARGAKDFTEALHPRDREGQFADKPGVALPSTEREIRRTLVRGAETFLGAQAEHGGPGYLEGTTARFLYETNHFDQAHPEIVTDEQRARCEAAATGFLSDPKNQPLFKAYGKPEVMVAGRTVSSSPIAGSGDDPTEFGVTAQWNSGTIVLYGPVVGDKNFPTEPGYSVGGADPQRTLDHEYGHQMMNVIGYDAHGDPSPFRFAFAGAMGEGTGVGGLGEVQWGGGSIAEAAKLKENAAALSSYAAASGPDEAFAEAFAITRQPGFNIDDYTGGTRDALQLILDRIAKDT